MVDLPKAVSPAAVAVLVRRAADAAGVPLAEVVPGAVTVLVVGTDGRDVRRLGSLTAAAAAAAAAAAGAPEVEDFGPGPAVGEVIDVPVAYDGEDLAAVADATGSSAAGVVTAHSGTIHTVAFCGFAPGFSYLEGLPASLQLPRRASPRTVVPAGSVAIADRYSAVYPGASPGGWHLLGRTDLTVWDTAREPPALLRPGTRVRFLPVGSVGPVGPAMSVGPAGPGSVVPVGSDGWLEVLDGGWSTTVQDPGRPGRADLGVPPSGWLDARAATLANRLVGNPPETALLEATARGPRLRLAGSPRSRAVAVTGPEVDVRVDGHQIGCRTAVELHRGAIIEVGTARGGLHPYVAVAGGVVGPRSLGSRATDTLGRLGPPPLRTGAVVALGDDHGLRPAVDAVPTRRPAGAAQLRIHVGPRAGWFAASALDTLVGAAWTVGAEVNRAGIRLTGPHLSRRLLGELPPEGMVTGSLQVPPSGQPVLLLADHPTTGGYPVIAVVDDDDLSVAGQLTPGATVRFTVSVGRTGPGAAR